MHTPRAVFTGEDYLVGEWSKDSDHPNTGPWETQWGEKEHIRHDSYPEAQLQPPGNTEASCLGPQPQQGRDYPKSQGSGFLWREGCTGVLGAGDIPITGLSV